MKTADLDLYTDYLLSACGFAMATGLSAMVDASVSHHKVTRFLSGHFVESNITNAVLESINSKIQLAKRRARGFRNINNHFKMIFFLCWKLTFAYPRHFT
jgi:Transposase